MPTFELQSGRIGSVGGERGLDTLEGVSLAYLLLPLVIFISAWLQPLVALTLGTLMTLSCVSVLRERNRFHDRRLLVRTWLLLAIVAALWIGLSGLAGALPLNEDWSVRMLVLRDLTVGAWPVSYGAAQDGQILLRFSMGYYLPAAVIGKLTSVEGARIAQAIWTFVGVLLFFGLAVGEVIATAKRKLGCAVVVVLVIVLFSGMDVLGLWIDHNQLPAFGEHLEWWARWMQYSSQTTLLFWAPNHALPVWLAAGVIWRHRDVGLATSSMAVLMLSVTLWSPLAAAGLAPLMLLCSAKGLPFQTWLSTLLRPPVIAVLPTAGLVARFVTFGVPEDVVALASEMTLLQVSMLPTLVPLMLRFAVVEWAVLALLLAQAVGGARRLPGLVWVAMAELLCLPLLRFGPGNDVVMRGGIAPMTVLALAVASALVAGRTPLQWRLALLAVLVVGSVTPLMELQRQFMPGSRWPDDGKNLMQHIGQPWHYVGVLSPGWLQFVLRKPVPGG